MAPANSMMEANTIACFKVNDREETDVAKALATSLAPVGGSVGGNGGHEGASVEAYRCSALRNCQQSGAMAKQCGTTPPPTREEDAGMGEETNRTYPGIQRGKDGTDGE